MHEGSLARVAALTIAVASSLACGGKIVLDTGADLTLGAETGDGDPGDGDPGDGDPGDGDPSMGVCGWNGETSYYECGFRGSDPSTTFPYECPEGLVEGEPCDTVNLTGAGCCDVNGDNWYCDGDEVVAFVDCD